MILGAMALATAALFGGTRLLEWFLEPAQPSPPPQAEPGAEPQSGSIVASEQVNQGAEQELNHYLAVSGSALAISGFGGLFFPPISVVGAAGIVYTCVPIFQRAYQQLFEQRRLRVSLLDAFATLSVLLNGFYFAGALGNTVYFLGRKLLLKTEDQSRKELSTLFGRQPRKAWILRGELEIEMPLEELQAGDLVAVHAGQPVPVDGVVRSGVISVDQSLLTGEAQPIERGIGDQVLASTLVVSGRAHIEAKQMGNATLVEQIGTMLNRTADYRSTVEAQSEKAADLSVLPLFALSGLALATVGTEAAVTVLSGNFVDGIRVGLPLSMLNVLKQAGQRNILIKDGRALELLQQVDTIVFDKTGTLTLEQPRLGDIYPCPGFSADELLLYAATAEARQTHPIARAILHAAAERFLALPEHDQVRYEVGGGVQAEVAGQRVCVGSTRFLSMVGIEIPSALLEQEQRSHKLGHSLVYVAVGDRLGGALELCPSPRPEVRQVLAALRARGLKLCIISGDRDAPTRRLAEELGIDRYYAEVLPEGKAELVARLQREGGKVCFIGDGVNDTIALKTATCSISLSGATSLAVDTAQIVMLDGTLQKIPELFSLARDFQTTVRGNLAAAITPSVALIGGVFFLGFGIYASLIFYNLSLLASLGIAMLPALRGDRSKRGPECANRPLGGPSS